MHGDVERSTVRPEFKRAWRVFYNRWLTYQELRAEREARETPAYVLDTVLPGFATQLRRWRDALAAEPGGKMSSARIGAEAAGSGIPWQPILIALGAGTLALLGRWWWTEREQAQREAAEQLAASRTAVSPASVYAAMQPIVATVPPPVWPMPAPWAAPALPPGYAVVRVGP